MSGWVPARVDGYAPIEQYGLLSNGRTVALVAGDGRIDWWPLPTTDAPPVFAALIDNDSGGRIELQPEVPFTVTREYAGDSNVLVTTFHTASGTVRVTDALTVSPAGRLPWAELVRRVDGAEGAVPMRWAIHPGTRLGSAQPWVEQHEGSIVVHCGDQHLALLHTGIGEPVTQAQAVSGAFRTGPPAAAARSRSRPQTTAPSTCRRWQTSRPGSMQRCRSGIAGQRRCRTTGRGASRYDAAAWR